MAFVTTHAPHTAPPPAVLVQQQAAILLPREPLPPAATSTAARPSSSAPGYGPSCMGEVACSSLKELRLKGSSFLRTHASKHGITNASRKLTSHVLQDLTEHYAHIHNVVLRPDDGPGVAPGVGAGALALNGHVTVRDNVPSDIATLLPQQPVPRHLVPLHPPQIQIQTQAQGMKMARPEPAPVVSSSLCTAAVMASTREQLAGLGTSLLRPEAAAHKVPNASRKHKDIVIEELWQHYCACHARDLSSGALPTPQARPKKPAGSKKPTVVEKRVMAIPGAGWVGVVVDDEEMETGAEAKSQS